MTVRIKRATSAQWADAYSDHVLLSGEPAMDLDTGVVKFGDGESTWSELSGGAGTIEPVFDTEWFNVNSGVIQLYIRRQGSGVEVRLFIDTVDFTWSTQLDTALDKVLFTKPGVRVSGTEETLGRWVITGAGAGNGASDVRLVVNLATHDINVVGTDGGGESFVFSYTTDDAPFDPATYTLVGH